MQLTENTYDDITERASKEHEEAIARSIIAHDETIQRAEEALRKAKQEVERVYSKYIKKS